MITLEVMWSVGIERQVAVGNGGRIQGDQFGDCSKTQVRGNDCLIQEIQKKKQKPSLALGRLGSDRPNTCDIQRACFLACSPALYNKTIFSSNHEMEQMTMAREEIQM